MTLSYLKPFDTCLLLDAAAGIVHRLVMGGMLPSWAPSGDSSFVPGVGGPSSFVAAKSGRVIAEVPGTASPPLHVQVLWSPVSNLCLFLSTMQLLDLTAPSGQRVPCLLDMTHLGGLPPIGIRFSPCGGVLVSCLMDEPARSLWPGDSCMKHWVFDPDFRGSSSGLVRAPGGWHDDELAWHPTLRRCQKFIKAASTSLMRAVIVLRVAGQLHAWAKALEQWRIFAGRLMDPACMSPAGAPLRTLTSFDGKAKQGGVQA